MPKKLTISFQKGSKISISSQYFLQYKTFSK
jgi:hypothetical protein